MKVIYIKSYKKKILILSLALLLWIGIFLSSNILFNNSLLLKITINNDLTFSYPFAMQIDNIYFNEHLNVNSIQTNMSIKKPLAQKFSNFNSINGKFSFEYPSIFTINQQELSGSDILYHIDFYNSLIKSHGFVQVWSISTKVKEFLDKSRSTSQVNFTQFESKPITVNKLNGYYWSYTSLNKDNKKFKGNEIFLENDSKMYRISYFVPEEAWDKNESNVFWGIVNSFKIN